MQHWIVLIDGLTVVHAALSCTYWWSHSSACPLPVVHSVDLYLPRASQYCIENWSVLIDDLPVLHLDWPEYFNYSSINLYLVMTTYCFPYWPLFIKDSHLYFQQWHELCNDFPLALSVIPTINLVDSISWISGPVSFITQTILWLGYCLPITMVPSQQTVIICFIWSNLNQTNWPGWQATDMYMWSVMCCDSCFI